MAGSCDETRPGVGSAISLHRPGVPGLQFYVYRVYRAYRVYRVFIGLIGFIGFRRLGFRV